MRLLKREHNTFSLTEFSPSKIPSVYAILSHRWGSDEVKLEDVELKTPRSKDGYRKLEFCADQAARDGIVHFWIDTCCIDKSNSTEFSEAINSMFKWYQSATKCYVYLPDVSTKHNISSSSANAAWESAFETSAWFTRGWTLQELIAPKVVRFFSLEGEYLGDKTSLERQIHQITGLPIRALQGSPLSQFDVDERFSWSAQRITTIEEDTAYCLLGLFDIQMPLLYGEGREKALARLRRKVHKYLNPTSLNGPKAPRTVPFERNPRFTGRESELAKLGETFFASDYTSKWAITGLGGVGKTQLVLELLYRTKAKYPDCTMIWIPATSNESLHQGYVAVARQLNIPGCENENTNVQVLVQQHLNQVDIGRWLLVFDNADDMNMWTALPKLQNQAAVPQPTDQTPCLIDTLPQNRQGCIIFTTRDKKLATKLAGPNILSLSEMGEEAAMGLLGKYIGDPSLADQQDDAAKLVVELTYLPLAIAQAATYIIANSITLAEYLDLLEEKEEEVIGLLSEDFEDYGRYREAKNPIALTWLCSFEQIRKHDQLAADYLSFMACIHPKDIPYSILPETLSPRRQKEAIGTLIAYSFVSKNPSGCFLNLHRLVHLATRNWLRKELILDSWLDETITRLEEVFPPDDDKNRNIWRMYLPHVLQLLESDRLENNGRQVDKLMYRCGKCLYRDGRWDEAERVFAQYVEKLEQRNSSEYIRDLWACRHWLASIYANQGRWDEAEKLQLRVLEAETTRGGPDNDNTSNSRSVLADIYQRQGRWTEAEELYLQVLESHKAKLGMDHPCTLTTMGNLSTTYTYQGRWKEAEKLDLQVLESRKVKLGVVHSATLSSMSNLASTYLDQGRLEEAEELNLKVLETSKSRLGPDHPHTLTSMNNLAWTYVRQGRSEEVEELLSQVLETQKSRLGPDHPDTLLSVSNFVWTYLRQGQLAEAEELCSQVLVTQISRLGPDHPDTLVSMNNLASIYVKQRRLEEAEELQVRVLESGKTKMGLNHPDTLANMHNLACTWKDLGRDAQAIQLLKDCVEQRARVLGVQHPHYLDSIAYLREWQSELVGLASQNDQLLSDKAMNSRRRWRWRHLSKFWRVSRT